MSNYHYYDSETGTVVSSEVDPSELRNADLSLHPVAVQRALASWAEDVQTNPRNRSTLFGRDKYVTPSTIFEIMEAASKSVDDDVVSNFLDSSESVAFHKVHFEVSDKDQEDVWNQIARDVNLDRFIRQAWRDLNVYSQFYVVSDRINTTYKVRGSTPSGNRKRKEYSLYVPSQLGLLDPMRVVPVNRDVFGNEQYAWIATDSEAENYERDLQMGQLFVGRYMPSVTEKLEFGKHDIPVDKLLLLNPSLVWGHGSTKSSYERWSPVRMKSIFPLLDLKSQLRDMDRAWLLGGVNFIVLVKRGDSDRPAKVSEVEATASQVRAQSKSPVIVTDHRIDIEIITPDVEHVLNDEKWSTLDKRIMTRLWMSYAMPQNDSRETSSSLGNVIARGLTSKRHMLKRAIEENFIKPVLSEPLNISEGFTAEARVQFTPRRMEYSPEVISLLQSLRDRGDLSRETVLSEFNFSQKLEAERREYEDEVYEEVFTPVNVPFDSPGKTTPDGSGRTGGGGKNKNVGGNSGGEENDS